VTHRDTAVTAPPPHALLRLENPVTRLRDRDFLLMEPLLAWTLGLAPGYAQGTILDYGCGNMPYRATFEPRGLSYIGVDVEQNKPGTVTHVIPPGGRLPLADASVDTVLSTQVLEHVADADGYLAEVERVLRPGGHLILTCPGSYMLHEEPNDYFRYTRYGLRALAARHALDVVCLEQAGGAWRLLGLTYLNHKTYYRSRRIPLFGGVYYRMVVPLVNIVCRFLDDIWYNDKETSNYMMIARRTARTT
jgi:SAM-dependent methyltransferase